MTSISLMQIIFLLVAVVTLAAAVMVVSVRRMMHAALWLILALFGVAVLFAMLESRFFAVVQLLIYIGAIAILVIFAVMLTRRASLDVGRPVIRGWWLAALVCIALFGGLVVVLGASDGFSTAARSVPAGGEDLAALGSALVDPNGFVIPFEVASVLLVAAMLGAVYIASDRKGGKRE